MKKTLLLTLIAIFISMTGYSQSLWTKTSEGKLSSLEKVDRNSYPKEYQIFHLNYEALKAQLKNAPQRESGDASNLIVSFPNADGKLEKFRIYESSVLEPELAKRHPELQSYVGQSLDNPGASIYFSTTIFGLHGLTKSTKETSYIDPYTKNLENYIVFNRSSRVQPRQFGCQVNDEDTAGRINEEDFANVAFANDGILRTYRLALACTVEYAAFHINAAGVGAGTLAQKKAAVLAAMQVSLVRLNSVYETEMSLRMVLVANNENVIFVESDNFTNSPDMIDEIQPIMDAAIGSANYDIGHGFCTTDSGIAQLQSVCGSGKARGITGQPNPVGDSFDIDYVSHEMGHQFGATHTQNNACNRTASTAVEPGSGSTIMSYAGICAPNVQSNADDYFHAVSLAQMFSFVTSSGACSTNTPNGNIAPVITPTTNYTVPAGTPFVLRGNATDANGDTLTYCWEQTNAGASSAVPSATSTASNPNFRSVRPTTSPNRYFPSLATLAIGSSAWEVLPTVARTMTFALTVRDNRTPNGGQTARQNATITTSTTSAPFTVTSQNTDGISWTQGTTQTITWNVAGTASAPFNTANVNILLSTDGGLTYPTVLATNIPNNGSQAITVPNVAAPFCRIMVEAVGNIYFAVNTKAFAIGYNVVNSCTQYPLTVNQAIPDGGTQYSVSAINVPTNTTISDVKIGMNITHPYVSDLQMLIQSPSGSQAMLWQQQCGSNRNMNVVFSDAGATPTCATPTTGTISAVDRLSVFNGGNAAGNWLLGYVDVAAQDAGTLNSWYVEICSQTITLNTENFGLNDFKVYPNPNKGNFTVQFDSNSGNNIDIFVYDIRGRQIFNKSFENSGLFNQNLELNNIQSGIYMVTVQDGDKKETRKIVIQ